MADVDTSGNGAQLDCSVDSGICVDVMAEDLKKKLQEFKRILFILERDKEARRLLRERLSRIAERKIIKKKKNEQFCSVCFTPIDTEDSKTCIACCSCDEYVCRGGKKCSELVPKDGEWRCRLCTSKTESYGKTSTWVEEQYTVKRATPAYAYPMRARSEIYIPLCDPNDSAFLCNFESVSEAPSTINVNQKQQIREYIEEVLAEMLGGSLDSTSVGPVSRSENYIPIGNEHELQGISHVRLRRLIESIIAETVRLPAFLQQSDTTPAADQQSEPLTYNGNQCNGDAQHYFEPKRYQDLLATAVLNKIVDSHGNERHSESSPDLTSSAFDKNHNALFPNKTTDDSISSSSSIEPRSESSLTDPLHNINKRDENVSPIGSYGNFYADVANENIEVDRESVLSDFIASHMVPLPHISADPASEEDDEEDEDFISVTSSSRDNWEDNWLFKKKRSGKITSSIGMLVPAPKENIRALIGDKPTDEVSDLSEVGSDTDDSSLEMVSATLEPLNDRLVNKHLIGGKNTKVVLDELVEQSSMISTSSLPENARPYTDTKNEFVVSNDGFSVDESSKMSLSNCNMIVSNEAINSNVSRPFTNNDSAQTEMSAKGPEILEEEESIVPPPSDFTDDEKMRNLMAKFHEEQNNKVDSGDENSSSLSPHSSISCALSGSIAEREYKKWYNAVDMPNNPYSVEALKRRLSGGPEKFFDLPNISPSIEEMPVALGVDETKVVDDKNQERDYARYSRDYYINDAKHASGATKKHSSTATTPTAPIESPAPPSTSSSPTEFKNNSEDTIELQQMTPVKAMCRKLEKQCIAEIESEVYTATPARVEEYTSLDSTDIKDSIHVSAILPLTTDAVLKLSSETSSVPTAESLTPSEDSDTIRIYDLKKQETRIIKDNQHSNTTTTPLKKTRPTELDITPTVVPPTGCTSSKSSTPTSFKFLQPKRKLIDPSHVLSIDLDTNPISPTSTDKTVIEEEVVHALPSVRALAQAFLLTSSHDSPKPSWRKARAKSPNFLVTSTTAKATASPSPSPLMKPTATITQTPIPTIQKPPEPTVVDTSSHGSEDATIASDLSSLETDPPSKQEEIVPDTLALARQSSQERPLSPVLVPGCLRNNIAFFENLKNK